MLLFTLILLLSFAFKHFPGFVAAVCSWLEATCRAKLLLLELNGGDGDNDGAFSATTVADGDEAAVKKAGAEAGAQAFGGGLGTSVGFTVEGTTAGFTGEGGAV